MCRHWLSAANCRRSLRRPAGERSCRRPRRAKTVPGVPTRRLGFAPRCLHKDISSEAAVQRGQMLRSKQHGHAAGQRHCLPEARRAQRTGVGRRSPFSSSGGRRWPRVVPAAPAALPGAPARPAPRALASWRTRCRTGPRRPARPSRGGGAGTRRPPPGAARAPGRAARRRWCADPAVQTPRTATPTAAAAAAVPPSTASTGSRTPPAARTSACGGAPLPAAPAGRRSAPRGACSPDPCQQTPP
mmetsp:Transcript_127837/g.361857  ORF Transcript_127837/g.361857 Transcript_127837/m.361857 type:complete len:244 (+) Transcript_127837:349-1080(+)